MGIDLRLAPATMEHSGVVLQTATTRSCAGWTFTGEATTPESVFANQPNAETTGFAIMKLLFVTGRTYLPDRTGGAEQSVHSLLISLVGLGHECEVAARADSSSSETRSWLGEWFGRLLRSTASDRSNGYVTWRYPGERLLELAAKRIKRYKPDIVLTQLDASEEVIAIADKAGVPAAVMIRDVFFEWYKGDPPVSRPPLLISNSEFVAARVRSELGRDSTTIYPVILPDQYRVSRSDPKYITMISPNKKKGIDLVLTLASRLTHRQFLLVEGWPLYESELLELETKIAAMPNVTLRPWSLDMRTVYSETALLLVPSPTEEAFSRVIIEGHTSGIPVVATRIGGIPESMGDGGVLVEVADAPEKWIETIENLLNEPEAYNRLSESARVNAGRRIFEPNRNVQLFVEAISDHIGRSRDSELLA